MARPTDQLSIWSRPGLYIAQLRSRRLVPIDLDKRREHNVLLVNCDDLKIGSARKLGVRRRNYEKTFDGNLALFEPVVLTIEIAAAEAAAKAALASFRIRNPHTNHRHEWLHGISRDEAVARILDALTEAKISFEEPVRVTDQERMM